ncbi:MAG: DUF1489 domain-containing protein [Alphaproteobacteria bacterium]|nr:DUF1489 domain-containing protein [Alphaproteobacteria bacterium]
MSLHLIKLCVGVDSIEDLRGWQKEHLAAQKKRGQTLELKHTTRMVPKRRAEILAGGSLYWVIKGHVALRQKLLDIRPFVDKEGIGRCHLVYDKDLVLVSPRPRRPFQGWRYLAAKEAPPDIGKGGAAGLPDKLRRELAELGLL